MDQPVAYLNGQIMPAEKAVLPIDDAGFALGATVTEQLRTFGGKLFRVDRHLDRLSRSLVVCGLAPEITLAEFGRIAEEIAAHNHRLLDPADDLGLAIFVTPGPYAAIASGRRAGLTVGLHTFPLAFDLWAAAYTAGVSLVLTPVEQISARCWPPELKCRSRMHYFLADRHAAAIERGARALLLDAAGYVTETATANVVICKSGEGLVTPPRGGVLPGMSLEAVAELAAGLGIPFGERPLLPADVATADEMLLSSTPYGIVPVTRFNGRALGSGRPGPIFTRLLTAWNELAGLDMATQAQQFAPQRSAPAKKSSP